MCRNQLKPTSDGVAISKNDQTTPSSRASSATPSIPALLSSRERLSQLHLTKERRQKLSHGKEIRLVIMGAQDVGKSAFTVRYLTKRYISEYRRHVDLLYRATVTQDDITTSLQLLDVSKDVKNLGEGPSPSHLRWGDGFAVLYAIDDRSSFEQAEVLLQQVSNTRPGANTPPTVLIANKCDLEPGRQVSVEEGQNLSRRYDTSFYELSAAHGFEGVQRAFETLLKETRAVVGARNAHRQRRLSIVTVSRMLGSLIGRSSGSVDSPPYSPDAPPSKHTLVVQDGSCFSYSQSHMAQITWTLNPPPPSPQSTPSSPSPNRYKKNRRKDKKRPSLSL